MPRDKLQQAKEASSFSQLTYLLRIVTVINSYNDSTSLSNFRHRDGEDIGPSSASHLLNLTVLDAIAAILVQKHEVVAACYTSEKVTVLIAETEANPGTDQDDNSSLGSLLPGAHTLHPLHLAALSNPDFGSNSATLNTNTHNLQIQTKGNNLWAKIRDSYKWYCVLL